MSAAPLYFEANAEPVPIQFVPELVKTVNALMRIPAWGHSLHLASPYCLGADPEPPLPRGIRRIIFVMQAPFERDLGVPDAEAVVFRLLCKGTDRTLQLSAEDLLAWVSQAESVGATLEGIACDVSDPATLRGLAASPSSAKEDGALYKSTAAELNRAADAIRAAVADPANWVPIDSADEVTATVSAVYEYPQQGGGK
ncbi:hypothetical protein [Luteibacter sp.]|uniref:hypothetical protein n=1 Tax=Luteibacter sp. TaxID=1886636 RepID=UPI003F80E75C